MKTDLSRYPFEVEAYSGDSGVVSLEVTEICDGYSDGNTFTENYGGRSEHETPEQAMTALVEIIATRQNNLRENDESSHAFDANGNCF